MERAQKPRARKEEGPDELTEALFPWGGPALFLITAPSLIPDGGQMARFGFWSYIGASYNTRAYEYGEFKRGKISRDRLRKTADRPFQLVLKNSEKNGDGIAAGPISMGVFFNPALCSEDEIETVKKYTERHGMCCANALGFVRKVLFKKHFIKGGKPPLIEPKLICGIDLANAIASLSCAFNPTRDGRGFTLRFRDCLERQAKGEKSIFCTHPRVSGKELGGSIAIFPANNKNSEPAFKFLDLAQLGNAIGVPPPPNRDQLLSGGEYEVSSRTLDEWRGSLANIVQSYFQMRDVYEGYDLKAPMTDLYSGGSIAKAMLRRMNIKPFMEQNPDFDRQVLGIFQSANYGGRTEAKMLNRPIEVMHLDFRSAHIASFSLLGLQKLLIADRVDAVRNDPACAAFLRTLTFDGLFKREALPRLCGAALVKPDGDILPFYGEKFEIAEVSGEPYWVKLPDVAASIVFTGKAPQILETIVLMPRGIQQGLVPYNLLGHAGFPVDPAKDDIFCRLAEMRSAVKDNDPYLGETIKNMAVSGAYGVFGRMNQDWRESSKPLTIHCAGASRYLRNGNRKFPFEQPKDYFAPYVSLVTAGTRLLLAMLEKSLAERGIDYAACDTDAMMPARPDGMTRDEFRVHVMAVVQDFEKLSPYRDGKPFLKIEKQCYSLTRPDVLEPLFYLGLETKKYAEYNLGKNKTPVIRHIAAIGLGDILMPPNYRSDGHEFIAGRHPALGGADIYDICNAAAAPLIMDLWRHAIRRFEAGEQDKIHDDLKKISDLKYPYCGSVQPTHPFEAEIYGRLPGFRPFMRLLRINSYDARALATGLPAVDRSLDIEMDKPFIFDAETGKRIAKLKHRNLVSRFQYYFAPPEEKTGDVRRRVKISAQYAATKETRDIKPGAIGIEIEPELNIIAPAKLPLFEVDGGKLKNIGRLRKTKSLFEKMARAKLFDDFYASCMRKVPLEFEEDARNPEWLSNPKFQRELAWWTGFFGKVED
jgi:hypothetical protein